MRAYDFLEVAPGAWACISNSGAGSLGNAGIVEVDGRTIVFDTGLTVRAGQALRDAAEQIAPVGCALVSHWHADHTVGAAAFGDVPVISTTTTRRLVDERARANLERFRTMDRETYFREAEPAEAADLRVLEQELGEVDLRLPDLCFQNDLRFYGVRERLELVAQGGGHTESDALLGVETDSERVVFAGDLVVDDEPWSDGGNVEDWLRALDWIERFDPSVIVPGHGGIRTIQDVRALRDDVQKLRTAA
jgi:cyclase